LVAVNDKIGVEMLLRGGIKPDNDINEYGWTPLHHAAMYDRSEIADLLLAYNADIHGQPASNKFGTVSKVTPLHLAANHGNVAMCLKLTEVGADADRKDSEKKTPMQWGANDEVKAAMKAGKRKLEVAIQTQEQEALKK